LCLRAARMRRRIFFFRHFQRMFPRFFHALEPRFIVSPRLWGETRRVIKGLGGEDQCFRRALF
jgi:hypothetical protein